MLRPLFRSPRFDARRFAGALALAASLLVPVARAETPASDPRAVAIADQVMQALGGKPAWDKVTGLRWSFEVTVNDTPRTARHHAWNKQTGWYRVEGKNRAGVPFVFIRNLNNDKEGRAWMDGKPIVGDSLQKLMKRTMSVWINDAYWLLMPYKLLDPGVHLGYEGEVHDSMGTFDRLSLSFDHVGLTPGDHYWVSVNRKNHRIERWDMMLEGQQPPPEHWTLEGWERHDGLWFATAHRQGTLNVFTNGVETVHEFPASDFKSP